MSSPTFKPPSFFADHLKIIVDEQKKSSKKEVDFLGKEPLPNDIKLPTKLPVVRVGIVLEEDEKKEISFTCDQVLFGMDRSSNKVQLKANTKYVVGVNQNQLFLTAPEYPEKILLDSTFTIDQTSGARGALKAGGGITVHNIVAGRHFHWRKEISETFPGTLEFSPDFERLVLVNCVDFETYTTCVVGSEMSGKGLPKEFAKAQAVAARSWTYVFSGQKYPGRPYTVCNDDMSQRYQGTTHISSELIDILRECNAEYMVDSDGFVSPCFYSKSTGGHAELSENVFGFPARGIVAQFDCPKENIPDLNLRNDADFEKWLKEEHYRGKKIFCSPEVVPENDLKKFIGAVDNPGQYFRWQYVLSDELLVENLKNKFKLDVKFVANLIPGSRGVSGRYLSFTVEYFDSMDKKVSFLLPTQFSIRAAFHESFLFSSAFTFDIQRKEGNGTNTSIDKVSFFGAGWGHGVGLCQIGALGMSFLGYDYKEILQHYFSKARVVKAY